ncbi:PREDICTED: serine/threonine-protein phosphatase 6 regulatory subunit 3 [Papilio polytes]|uniref:serine/threonine-protein phosphatase 6 regulatory subunit 3 n=1 Tax=Papilio polytes TaxID=76194 RepID=UPI000675D85F|nr:PREDICTED: serine/threonine-protein phosphatase 6 regulatory subunit 3 [Papilio polytes]
MFWSGNFIVVRELNNLLKEENVTLTQVLEADDILQECKADNKALMLFLTKSEILAELVTLITEEPPENVDLASQYRHAHIASEVLTSQLMMLSDRLSMDAVQMNRLCDFVNKDPPLNPLLASYFSKTIEMLLEKSPKQDWYLYHIVCLRVLDFFKSRRDFLPNLLRHISTSSIADIFKYFIRLDDPFNKIILEWLEENQFLESLIHIVCGTYEHEEVRPVTMTDRSERSPEQTEKGQQETSEKVEMNHKEGKEQNDPETDSKSCDEESGMSKKRIAEAGRASANAAALLCDLLLGACAPQGSMAKPLTSWTLVSRLRSEECVRLVLQCMFTSPAAVRRHAVVNGCQLLLALLPHDSQPGNGGGVAGGGEGAWCSSSVQRAVAPHLPLLHQALLRPPAHLDNTTSANTSTNTNTNINSTEKPKHEECQDNTEDTECIEAAEECKEKESNREESEKCERAGGVGGAGGVGAARVHVAALIAQLAFSDVEDVHNALITLGTAGVLLDMFFDYPQNNFLHTQVYILIHNALSNSIYGERYAKHLIDECNLLTRLMDTFEENENTKGVRRGNMGHVVLALRRLEGAAPALPAAAARWRHFRDTALRPLLQRHDTPLGGFYPSENIYDFNEASSVNENVTAVQLACDNASNEKNFLEVAGQRFDDDMWEDTVEGEGEGEADAENDNEQEGEADPARVREILADVSPWDTADDNATDGTEWANFGDVFATPIDPFAPVGDTPPSQHAFDQQDFAPFWHYNDSHNSDANCQGGLDQSLQALSLGGDFKVKPMDDASTAELTNNLLTAMSSMTPDVIADIVSAMPQPDELVTPLELVQPLSEPLTEPIQSLTEPIESHTEPIESLTKPIESLTKPIESHTEPIESLTTPVTEPVSEQSSEQSSEEPSADR